MRQVAAQGGVQWGRVATGRAVATRPAQLAAAGLRQYQWPRPSAQAATAPPGAASDAAAAETPSTSMAERDAAWEMLRDFTLKEFRGAAQAPYLASADTRQRLREALMLAYGSPHPPAGWLGPDADMEVLLGVVASDIKFALRAYRDWCDELGVALVTPSSRVDGVGSTAQIRGGVYLKYNSKTQVCYVSRYDGKDRGVLVQLGQLQLGHFPLGFFDEGMVKPAPSF